MVAARRRYLFTSFASSSTGNARVMHHIKRRAHAHVMLFLCVWCSIPFNRSPRSIVKRSLLTVIHIHQMTPHARELARSTFRDVIMRQHDTHARTCTRNDPVTIFSAEDDDSNGVGITWIFVVVLDSQNAKRKHYSTLQHAFARVFMPDVCVMLCVMITITICSIYPHNTRDFKPTRSQ